MHMFDREIVSVCFTHTLGRAQGMKLKVFVGAEHTFHAAQQPEVFIFQTYSWKNNKVCQASICRYWRQNRCHRVRLCSRNWVKSLLPERCWRKIPHADLRLVINQPFAVTSTVGSYDVFVNRCRWWYAVNQELSATARFVPFFADPDFRDHWNAQDLHVPQVERKKPGLKKARIITISQNR